MNCAFWSLVARTSHPSSTRSSRGWSDLGFFSSIGSSFSLVRVPSLVSEAEEEGVGFSHRRAGRDRSKEIGRLRPKTRGLVRAPGWLFRNLVLLCFYLPVRSLEETCDGVVLSFPNKDQSRCRCKLPGCVAACQVVPMALYLTYLPRYPLYEAQYQHSSFDDANDFHEPAAGSQQSKAESSTSRLNCAAGQKNPACSTTTSAARDTHYKTGGTRDLKEERASEYHSSSAGGRHGGAAQCERNLMLWRA